MILEPVAAARALRATLGDAASPALRALLTAVDGDGAAWRRACQGSWREPALRARLAAVAGLRTTVRRVAIGGVDPAIADLVAQRIAVGRPEAHLVVNDGALLWLPDLVFAELAFDLEMDQDGGIAGEEPLAPTTRWRRFLAWAADGAVAGRGHVAHPRWPGAFPAWSLPASSPRVRPIVQALRGHAVGPTAVVADPARALVAWWAGRLDAIDDDAPAIPTRDALVAAVGDAPWSAWAEALRRRGADRAMLRGSPTLRAADDADPMPQVASHATATVAAAPTDALAGLAQLVRDGVVLALTSAQRDGVLRRAAPLVRGAAPLIAAGPDDALCVEPEGLAGIVAWLGLAPTRYDLRRGQTTWDLATLVACGWSALVDGGHWRWVAHPESGRAPWLALDAAVAAAPAAAPASRDAMRIDAQ